MVVIELVGLGVALIGLMNPLEDLQWPWPLNAASCCWADPTINKCSRGFVEAFEWS